MSQDLKLIQEGVKLALDAADAAADVTSEYNKVKMENIKLVNRVAGIYKTSGLIAFFGVTASFASLGLALFIHFNSVSDLEVLTKTNRQALVVFAENVDTMNKTIAEAQGVFDRQNEIIQASQELQTAISDLSAADEKNTRTLDTTMQDRIAKLMAAQTTLKSQLENSIASLKTAQSKSAKSLEKAIMASRNSDNGKHDKAVVKSLQDVLLLQQNINKKLVKLIEANSNLLSEVRQSSKQIKYP